MKRITLVLALAMALLVTVLAGWALAGIEGSKHDLSNKAWSGGDECGVCHSPHRDAPPKAAPLWDSGADLNRTLGTPIGQKAEADSSTRICIRCHDGTIARDSVTGVIKARYVNKLNPALFGTGHGRSDHPVGVKYPRFDKGFRPVTTVLAKGAVRLPGGRVECISCHDQHNQSGQTYMLVMSNARSALCLTCHNK